MEKEELLKQLAEDTGLAEEVIEKERLSKPSLLKDFFRGMRHKGLPDGYEIRNKITIMVRTAAFEGHAIIIGQGGTAATRDLDGGLSVRIEGPKEWRIARVSVREKLKRAGAVARIEEIEKGPERPVFLEGKGDPVPVVSETLLYADQGSTYSLACELRFARVTGLPSRQLALGRGVSSEE